MALEFLPADRQFRQIRVEYKKSAVLGDVIYPKGAGRKNGRLLNCVRRMEDHTQL